MITSHLTVLAERIDRRKAFFTIHLLRIPVLVKPVHIESVHDVDSQYCPATPILPGTWCAKAPVSWPPWIQ